MNELQIRAALECIRLGTLMSKKPPGVYGYDDARLTTYRAWCLALVCGASPSTFERFAHAGSTEKDKLIDYAMSSLADFLSLDIVLLSDSDTLWELRSYASLDNVIKIQDVLDRRSGDALPLDTARMEILRHGRAAKEPAPVLLTKTACGRSAAKITTWYTFVARLPLLQGYIAGMDTAEILQTLSQGIGRNPCSTFEHLMYLRVLRAFDIYPADTLDHKLSCLATSRGELEAFRGSATDETRQALEECIADFADDEHEPAKGEELESAKSMVDALLSDDEEFADD